MAKRVRREWFSRPENETRIRSSWERFLSGDGKPSDALRCLVDDSWRRCLTGSVNPLQDHAPPPLTGDRLAALRQRHRRLIDASVPVMAQARDFLAQTGTVMILAEPQGTILDLEGDPRMRDPLEDIHLIPGCNWTESTIGTNAIGTALALGQPIQIHAAEHFCAGIQQWTCSATVIHDPIDGDILGVLDVSGLSRSYSRHSVALAVTAAGRIESRLSRLEMERRFKLMERCMGQLSVATTDGLIVFDHGGHLVKANDRAADAFAVHGIQLELSAGTRIAALNADLPDKERPSLPAWLRPEWVEPVGEGAEILGTVVRIPLATRRTHAERGLLGVEVATRKGFERVVGRSAALLDAVCKASHLARSHVPVLLLGETGVGKELFARGIHDCGCRASGPFVAVNCGGLSRDLLASELFGYVDGAFTGARRGGMIGKIEAANGGTLFLDEIGEMPAELQPHLLRVLEEGELNRVGESRPRKVDFRLVAATHRDLRREVANGRFRMDLFYRIAVTSIRIPPLRDRRDDIPLLVENMLSVLCPRHGVPLPVIDEAVLEELAHFAWPGNVRELRNVVESLLLMSGGDPIGVDDLPNEIRRHSDDCLMAPPATVTDLECIEQAQIDNVVRLSRGNLTLAARKLGCAKSTLYVKIKKYGMDELVQKVRVE